MNWKRLIAKYLEELSAAGFSEGTLAVRAGWLKRFLLWCNEQEIRSAPEVTAVHIDLYRQFLQCTPARLSKFYSLSTVNQALAILRQFFYWATDRGHLLFSPTAHLKLPRVEIRLTEVTPQEVQRLMDAATNDGAPAGLRDRAVLEMFYRGGIRRREMAQLTLADVDLQARTLRTRRRGKERLVPIDDPLAEALECYLHESRPQLAGDDATDALFLTLNGTPYTHFCLSEMLKRVNQRAGLRITSHMLRHASAVHMLAAGLDLAEVQRRLGNCGTPTAASYLRAATAVVQRQPRRAQTDRKLTHFSSLIEPEEPADDAT